MEIIRTFLDIRLTWQYLATNSTQRVIPTPQIKETLKTLTDTFDALVTRSHTESPKQICSTCLSDVHVVLAPHLRSRWVEFDIHVVCQDGILTCVYMNTLRRVQVCPEAGHIELPLSVHNDIVLVFKRGVLLEMNTACVLKIRSHPRCTPNALTISDWIGNVLRLNYVTSSSGDVLFTDPQYAISVCSYMDQQLAKLTDIIDVSAGQIAKATHPRPQKNGSHSSSCASRTAPHMPISFRYS